MHGERDDGRLARALDDLERQDCLAEPAEGLADDEIDARVERPADLLLECLAHAAHGFGIVGLVGIGVGQIAREQGAASASARPRSTIASKNRSKLAGTIAISSLPVVHPTFWKVWA